MKKIFITFTLLIAVIVSASAQEVMQDVVYLKNGNVIRGTIIEYVVGGKIKIKTADGSTINHSIDEITKFGREEIKNGAIQQSENAVVAVAPVYVPQSSSGYQKATRTKTSTSNDDFKRFNSSIELGSGFADYLTTFSLDYVARFNLIPQFSIGVGAGLSSTFTKDYWESPAIGVPVFLSLRSAFLKSKVSPYVGVDFGGVGLFPTNEGAGDASYEFYLNPTVGVQFKMPKNKSVYLGVGYLTMGEHSGQWSVKIGFNL